MNTNFQPSSEKLNEKITYELLGFISFCDCNCCTCVFSTLKWITKPMGLRQYLIEKLLFVCIWSNSSFQFACQFSFSFIFCFFRFLPFSPLAQPSSYSQKRWSLITGFAHANVIEIKSEKSYKTKIKQINFHFRLFRWYFLIKAFEMRHWSACTSFRYAKMYIDHNSWPWDYINI